MKRYYLFLFYAMLTLSTILLSCTSKKTTEPGTELPADLLERMVFIRGGTFNPAGRDFSVTLSDFGISMVEVTQEVYIQVMGYLPEDIPPIGVGPNYPVSAITWYDAVEFCNRASKMYDLKPVYSYGSYGSNPDNWPLGWNTSDENHTNVSCNWLANGFMLPSEMQWEYSARGGQVAEETFYDRFAGTNEESDLHYYAWYFRNSGDEWLYGDWWDYYFGGFMANNNRSHPVGTKLPNECDLYDMSGNVAEWVWDIYGPYPSGDHTDPTGPSSGTYRILRGGCNRSDEGGCAVYSRSLGFPTNTTGLTIGFRVSRMNFTETVKN